MIASVEVQGFHDGWRSPVPDRELFELSPDYRRAFRAGYCERIGYIGEDMRSYMAAFDTDKRAAAHA